MTLKEEKQLQELIRRHISRSINLEDKRFSGVLVESGKTIFSDGAILCVYDYVLPETTEDGFYGIPIKGELVLRSEVGPSVGGLHKWRTLIPAESVYTEGFSIDIDGNPDHIVSHALARLGRDGIALNLRYLLNLPRGRYEIKYLPREKDGGYTPVTLRRIIRVDAEFLAVLLPLPGFWTKK